MNLSKRTKISVAVGPQASGTGTKKDQILDMSGYQGVLLVVVVDTAVDTADVSLQVAESDLNSTGSMAVLPDKTNYVAGSSSSGDLDGKALVFDLRNPLKRYIEPQVVIATAAASISCVMAIKYDGVTLPEDLDTTVLADYLSISPEVSA